MPVSLKQALQELVRGPDLSAGNLTLVLSETIHTPRGWTIFLLTGAFHARRSLVSFDTPFSSGLEFSVYQRAISTTGSTTVCVGETTPNTRSTIVTHGTEFSLLSVCFCFVCFTGVHYSQVITLP